MFRFDGEVFLLGTAIPAPYLNKNATICASSRRGFLASAPTGGGRIVANRRPYSESIAERNPRSGRSERCVADIGIGLPFVAKGRHLAVPRHEGRLVAHWPQALDNRTD